MATAMVIGLAGCSSETPGDAQPGEGTGGGGVPTFPEVSTPEDTPTEPSETEGVSADLEPCELLSAQDLAALGLPASGKESDIGPARSCRWQTSGGNTVSVGVIDEFGLDDVQSDSPPEPMTVGSHEAVRYAGVGSTCAIAIALTESSRVDVLGTEHRGDKAKSCEVAKQAAELVEPNLP